MTIPRLCALFFVLVAALAENIGRADDRIILKDGFELTGKIEVNDNRITVQSGARTVYVSPKLLLKPEQGELGNVPPRFVLPQPATSPGIGPGALTRIYKMEGFDEFGRRSVEADVNRRKVTLIQAITELYPTHAVVRGMNHGWTSQIALSQIPSKDLLAMLKHARNPQSGPDQLKVVDFLIRAERLDEARTELRILQEKFSQLGEQAGELNRKLDRIVVDKALAEIKLAIENGQLIYAKRVQKSLTDYRVQEPDRAKVLASERSLNLISEKIQQIRSRLEKSAEQIPNGPDKATVQEAVNEIGEDLSLATLPRLNSYQNFLDKPGTSAAKELGLAISGWVIGNDLAQADLPAATKLWRQQRLLLDVIRATDEPTFAEALEKIRKDGARPDLLRHTVKSLPWPKTGIAPEKPELINFVGRGGANTKYHVVLPPEYDRNREYPAIVSLCGLHNGPERQIRYWTDAVKHHGYILIVPEYRSDLQKPYQYSAPEHFAVIDAIADARKRFAIDSDRVFLTGHELGGIVTWDMGMSHPDLFAGMIPVNGAPIYYCTYYVPNVDHLPVYAVEGNLNGANADVLARHFLKLFARGSYAIYAEYSGRGGEMFPDELPSLIDWMGRKKRAHPNEIRAVAARLSEKRFYWMRIDSFLPHSLVDPEIFNRTKFKSVRLDAKVSDDNTISVNVVGADAFSILIPENLVHADAETLLIKNKNKVVHKGPIEPDIETTLRELRKTGDRKNLIIKEIKVKQ